MTERGGPQLIPRPPGATQGDPAPWSFLPAEQRVITADSLRAVFTGRVGKSSIVEAEDTVRPSAVLAPFYDLDGELNVVLTRRSWGLRSHTGEVSFPGGRVDEGESVREAALREAYEEIRLEPASVEILGELDHLMTVTSRSFIVPHVALLADVPQLHPNPSEVDAVLHVPVRELLLDDVYREEHWIFQTPPPWVPPDAVVPDGPVERAIFFFELVGDTVWGATAAMLRHLLGLALDLGVGIDHV
ncbi:MAG TPA: CoA pyrophosphatase [Acidimicrobiales bacterium]|nr:CoA pyrophosphatase [Acidimicrobiales bacterium]